MGPEATVPPFKLLLSGVGVQRKELIYHVLSITCPSWEKRSPRLLHIPHVDTHQHESETQWSAMSMELLGSGSQGKGGG